MLKKAVPVIPFLVIMVSNLLLGCSHLKSTSSIPSPSAPLSSVNSVVQEQSLAAKNVWHKAKLRGVAFRAIGQEPAWLLEISTGESIFLKFNYGQDTTTYSYVEPVENKAKRQSVFLLEGLEILISGEPCSDAMSGENFESTVFITFNNGNKLKGCGRALY